MAATTLVCKVEHGGDVRRFNVEEPLLLGSLTATISQVFNVEGSATVRLVYTDRDGDAITLSTDEDLVDARAASGNPNLIRLRLVVTAAPKKESAEEPRSCWCDNCQTTIRTSDVRFKCGNCANFDLCDACESLPGVHDPSHVLLKFRPEAQVANGKLSTTTAILTSPLGQQAAAPAAAPAPPSTEQPATGGFNLNSLSSLLNNPAIAQMAAGLAAPKSQEPGAPKPQFDFGALAGMASSLLGPAMAQQQQPGSRAAGPDLSSLLGSLFAGVGQTPSATPAPAPTPTPVSSAPLAPVATPDAESEPDPLAALFELGLSESEVAQYLELSGGNVADALELINSID